MHKHHLRFQRQSMVLYKGKPTDVDIWKCEICKKYTVIATKSATKIILNDETNINFKE